MLHEIGGKVEIIAMATKYIKKINPSIDDSCFYNSIMEMEQIVDDLERFKDNLNDIIAAES